MRQRWVAEAAPVGLSGVRARAAGGAIPSSSVSRSSSSRGTSVFETIVSAVGAAITGATPIAQRTVSTRQRHREVVAVALELDHARQRRGQRHARGGVERDDAVDVLDHRALAPGLIGR